MSDKLLVKRCGTSGSGSIEPNHSASWCKINGEGVDHLWHTVEVNDQLTMCGESSISGDTKYYLVDENICAVCLQKRVNKGYGTGSNLFALGT